MGPGSGSAPLSGVRIISIEQFGAGPFATLALADLGAEVIKIEDPATGGDVGRYIPPGQSGSDSLYFESFNRNKKSIALDLKSSAGRTVFERLVTTADVVFNNLRGDLPETLALTYGHLSRFNPAVISVSLSAYGRRGPRRSEPGYDALIQAEAGWAALTGEPEAPPTKSGLPLADYAAGLSAALAMMVGIFDAKRTGRGRDIDVDLYGIALWMLTYPATWFLSSGHVTERVSLSAHPSIVPFQFFETSDGYLAIACGKERFFDVLANCLGLPDLANDERFASFEGRRAHRSDLTAILTQRLLTRTSAEWIAELQGKVPVAPVRSFAQALDTAELRERDLLVSYEHERLGHVGEVACPITFSGYRGNYRPAPSLAENRDEVLESLGYQREEIAALVIAGAFGSVA